jgi:hypothetical protein
LTDESRVRNHTKNTNHLTNTMTMVVEPPSPPVAWIWSIDAARRAGVLAQFFLEATIKGF